RRDQVKVAKSGVTNCVSEPSGRVRHRRTMRLAPKLPDYLTSTLAPTSSNFFLIVAASSLLTPSLIGLGAPSTRSLASLRPRLVTLRNPLLTFIFFAPT